jgi:hypothetical protein
MKKLMSLAAGLVGIAALAVAAATGRGEDAPIGCGQPPEPTTLKVHFARTPGVEDFTGFPAVDLDGSKLSADEVKELRKLIEDAHFFDLKSSPPVSPVVPDPPAGYDLTVEMDGRTNTIWVVDSDVSKSLQPLIHALTLRAKPWLEMVPIKALAEEEQPAIRIDFTKSGGIAGLHFPTTTIDSATLSAVDAQKLAKLIVDVRFFDLPELYPTHGADLFEYTITVELNGKRHTVSYDDEPAELKPLIDWLSSRPVTEVPVGCVIPL